MLDLALDEDLATIFTAQLLNSDEAAVGRLLTHPHSPVSLSDAGAPHLLQRRRLRPAPDGPLGAQRGVMSLAEAVRRLTSQSAAIFGIVDRGLLREGTPPTCCSSTRHGGPRQARRVHDLPGGMARLHTDAGRAWRGVNGAQVADGRGLVDKAPLAGELLTRFAH